jgi:hypothetical protein
LTAYFADWLVDKEAEVPQLSGSVRYSATNKYNNVLIVFEGTKFDTHSSEELSSENISLIIKHIPLKVFILHNPSFYTIDLILLKQYQ